MNLENDNLMPVKASVVIPVKNGGELLIDVLKQVLNQQTPWPFEVLVIDSGSSDRSVQNARALGVKVHEIPPEAFGHGKTRNLGVELSTGEFIVFITQDALPVDQNWLVNLIEATDSQANVAGAFGRHQAYPDAGPVVTQELQTHFQGFGDKTVIVQMDDPERYRQEAGYRQFLHFFSSNNACIRRSVWQKIPLPDADFAEDQLWAKAIIEAGYAKAYAPTACVYHSHEFGVLESYRRAFDESRSFKKHFGYDLAPDWKHIGRHWFALSKRDWRWIFASNHSFINKTIASLQTPWLNFAKLFGHYMGTKQARLPGWLSEYFSRDKTLQKS